MQIGDLVKLDPHDYPQYRDSFGIIIGMSSQRSGKYIVAIDGKIHEYFVSEISIKVVSKLYNDKS